MNSERRSPREGVEVRAIPTNVSSLCSVRIAARRCDARGVCREDGVAPVFESELGPLESAEHAAEGTEGRALLLGSTGASNAPSSEVHRVSHRSLERGAADQRRVGGFEVARARHVRGQAKSTGCALPGKRLALVRGGRHTRHF